MASSNIVYDQEEISAKENTFNLSAPGRIPLQDGLDPVYSVHILATVMKEFVGTIEEIFQDLLEETIASIIDSTRPGPARLTLSGGEYINGRCALPDFGEWSAEVKKNAESQPGNCFVRDGFVPLGVREN
ncbi:MAG: hypothetical protein HQK60_13010 [Deltaproteobacteria bacterium]|nr:hypothetical protein [Deltaproteobacteria bacterium]